MTDWRAHGERAIRALSRASSRRHLCPPRVSRSTYPRNSIEIDVEQGRLLWRTSVECGVVWWVEDDGTVLWRCFVNGEHSQRQAAMRDVITTWSHVVDAEQTEPPIR